MAVPSVLAREPPCCGLEHDAEAAAGLGLELQTGMQVLERVEVVEAATGKRVLSSVRAVPYTDRAGRNRKRVARSAVLGQPGLALAGDDEPARTFLRGDLAEGREAAVVGGAAVNRHAPTETEAGLETGAVATLVVHENGRSAAAEEVPGDAELEG